MIIRKPTFCERFFHRAYARKYNELFYSRCSRAINLTHRGVRESEKKKPLSSWFGNSFGALQAAAKMKGTAAVEREIFRFNQGGLVNAELSVQINWIYCLPAFKALVKEEQKV